MNTLHSPVATPAHGRLKPLVWWLRGLLGASLLAGFILGGAQQVRGAHFMSHTLWTGWLCWTVGWLCDLAASALRPRLEALSLANDPPHAAS